MIVYTLHCSKGHTFEEWFDSISDYESKTEAGEIPCLECGDRNVTKSVMAPHVNSGAKSPAKFPAPPCGGPECMNGVCPMAEGG